MITIDAIFASINVTIRLMNIVLLATVSLIQLDLFIKTHFKMVIKKRNTQVTFFFIGLLISVCSFSQKTSTTKQLKDSLLRVNESDTIVPFLLNKVQTYTLTIDRNTTFINRNIDLSEVKDTLSGIESLLKRFKLRLEAGSRTWNLRGLNSTSILLKATATDLTDFQKTLVNYSKQLTINNNDLQVILKDSLLNEVMPDSILQVQMDDVRQEAFELDTIQKSVLSQVNLLRNRVSVALFQAKDIVFDLAYISASQKRTMWQQEEPPLFDAKRTDYKKSFDAVISEAFQRMNRGLSRYLKSNPDILSLTIFVFIFLTVWSYLNMRKAKKLDDFLLIVNDLHFYRKGILLVGVFGLFTYGPFFFPNPTMSFLHTCELLRLIVLSVLLIPYLSIAIRVPWLLLCALWVFYAMDNLLLESAFGERWWLFIIGIAFILLTAYLLFKKGNYFNAIQESPAAKALLIFTLTLILLSEIFNLTGRVALAKICGVTAIQCLLLGITLKVFCTLVLEAIYLQTEAYKDSRFSAFINFKELQYRFKRVLWVLAIAVWLISLMRDVMMLDFCKMLLTDIISKTRNIGNMSFTYESILIFFIVIWVSTVISSFINFFFGHQLENKSSKRSSLGSMILIIRLSIWAIGFLIALAASGIPLDKLSIMLGALSVGIGFGLQNIVNNLVSGVIIAFEQPIQVGDQIEVGNKAGTVKEIGVRSSTIKSGDGADIIIPNGDLLSQSLINWTLQNRNKRVEFVIGIPYDTNLANAKAIIEETIASSEHILQTPAPVVIVKDFGEKVVTIRIMFWVPDLSIAGSLRSTLMLQTYEALKKADINPHLDSN